jgi:hypothetical protein
VVEETRSAAAIKAHFPSRFPARARMELSVFRVRVGPLLPADSLRTLRCVSRAWQETVDQLIPVKGALGLRPKWKWTPPDVRFAHASVGKVEQETALSVCAGGELQDLQWGLATFPLPGPDLHFAMRC